MKNVYFLGSEEKGEDFKEEALRFWRTKSPGAVFWIGEPVLPCRGQMLYTLVLARKGWDVKSEAGSHTYKTVPDFYGVSVRPNHELFAN
jgi:hypothetical protein